MKLYVQVVEAKNLTPRESSKDGSCDPFVRLSLGATKARTSVVHKCVNPTWNEDFFFNVADFADELKVTIWDDDRFTDHFLGQIRIPVNDVLNSEKKSIGKSWFRLLKRNDKSKRNIEGEILLNISLFGRSMNSEEGSKIQIHSSGSASDSAASVALSPIPCSVNCGAALQSFSSSDSVHSDSSLLATDLDAESVRSDLSPRGTVPNEDVPFVKEFMEVEKKKTAHGHALSEKISALFHKKGKKGNNYSPTASLASSDQSIDGFLNEGSVTPDPSLLGADFATESGEEVDDDLVPLSFFDDNDKSLGPSPEDLPPPLSGGVLVDQNYACSMKALNAVLFKPETPFTKELAEVQKTSEMVRGPWRRIKGGPIQRIITYRKAPTKLLKSVTATEIQTYVKTDDNGFAVLCGVSTPEVPYGKCFTCELLIVINPRLPLLTGEKTSRMQISWRINFMKNTILDGMVKSGAAQGLKESYIVHQELLSKYAKPVTGEEGAVVNAKEAGPVGMPKTDWELAREYFGNYTVLLTVLGFFLMLFHIIKMHWKYKKGLQFWFFDLPDSFGEVIVVALLTRQVERVGKMVRKFLTARLKASDHGVKAEGAGWLLTVNLLEAKDLYSIDSDGSCDPYVVFTCNGKIRTSSVILCSKNPEWKEVYEFDATEDPPSTLDIEVFDYDGPFAEAESLGHATINFLKSKANDYADVWLPLKGRKAEHHKSNLHLKVLLNNTKDGQPPECVNKVSKEAGTKIVKRSPQRNTQFQKLFSLPAEEFLINDYACAIKRKIPIQGRLFLSPRMLGFYSNLFGHKTKFSFLWEDVEEIKEAVSGGSVINPSLTITLRKGRALEAKQGSKGVDHHGRLRFQFLSFVRSGPAFRTIIALWKNRTLSVEQTMELIASVEGGGDMKYAVAERHAVDAGFVGMEEAHMSLLAERDFPATVSQISHLYEYGALDKQIMEMFGVAKYKSSPWEVVGDDQSVKRRQVSYVMSRQQCRFGSAVTIIQQKTVSEDLRKGLFEEIITLHDVPFGDHFMVQARRESSTVTETPPVGGVSHMKLYAGVAWHKDAGFQKKITQNILRYMTLYLKDYLEHAAKIMKETPAEAFQPIEPAKETPSQNRRPILSKFITQHT